jgi:hypothetical protein
MIAHTAYRLESSYPLFSRKTQLILSVKIFWIRLHVSRITRSRAVALIEPILRELLAGKEIPVAQRIPKKEGVRGRENTPASANGKLNIDFAGQPFYFLQNSYHKRVVYV